MKKKQITTICLIDPCLKDMGGHYFHYAYNLYQAAKTMGLNFVVLANKNVTTEVRQILPAEPVFRYDLWHKYISFDRYSSFIINSILSPLIANHTFYQDLNRALANRVDDSWLIFVVILPHQQLLALKRWITKIPPTQAPKLAMFLMGLYANKPNSILDYDFYASQLYKLWAKLSFAIFERSTINHTVVLATDNNKLIKEACSLSKLETKLLPFAYTVDSNVDYQPIQKNLNKSTATCHFISLGDLRLEKGVDLIAEALCYLEKQQMMEGLEFTIHAYVRSKSNYLTELQKKFINLRSTKIKIITEPLTTKEYYNLLYIADVVLLPYVQKEYASKTSGILSEAIAASKPVITTKNTWLSDQLKNYGAGLLIDDKDYVGLAQAILEAKQRMLELTEQAQKRSVQWVLYNNPTNFLTKLLELFD